MREIRDVEVKYLEPNPFRDGGSGAATWESVAEAYGFDEGKLEELQNSYRTNGPWVGIIVRSHPEDYKRFQLAFGHHRVEAARRMGLAKLPVVVENLSDSQMVTMMASENSEEYGHDFALGVMNAVEAVVRAYGAGKIKLAEPNSKQRAAWRKAPSFLEGTTDTDASHCYTAASVGRYLGWTFKDEKAEGGEQADRRVKTALAALELIERGALKRAQLKGLGSTQARELVTLTKRKLEAEEARLDQEADLLRAAAAKAQAAGEKAKLREAEKKLAALEDEAAKHAAKAGQQVAATVQQYFREGSSFKAAAEKAAAALGVEPPKPKGGKVKALDLSGVEAFTERLDKLFIFDDPSWTRVLKLAAESKATRPFERLETAMLRAAQRLGERVKELRKAVKNG